MQLIGPPPPPPPGPPAPAPGTARCPAVGFVEHAPGYWSNPTPNTSNTKPPVSVAECGAKCSADPACEAFEVYDPAGSKQCHTFEGTMKPPFISVTSGKMVTCVKNKTEARLAASTAAASSIYVVGARVAGYDTALFGLPPAKSQQQVILFDATPNVLVCTTHISNAVSARNGPIAAWGSLFSFVVDWALRSTATR